MAYQQTFMIAKSLMVGRKNEKRKKVRERERERERERDHRKFYSAVFLHCSEIFKHDFWNFNNFLIEILLEISFRAKAKQI